MWSACVGVCQLLSHINGFLISNFRRVLNVAQAIFEPDLFPYKYPNNLIPVILPVNTAYEDGTECSERSAYKIQTAGNHPKERIQHTSGSYKKFIIIVIILLLLLLLFLVTTSRITVSILLTCNFSTHIIHNKPTRCNSGSIVFINNYQVCSTCFGRSLHPSSGAL